MEVDRLLFLRPAYATRAPINYPPISGTRTWPPNIFIEKYIQTGRVMRADNLVRVRQ
jgi:hypothetical protein